MKLVHLVGFIIKKFVTMHGHLNVKFSCEHFKVITILNDRKKGSQRSYELLPCLENISVSYRSGVSRFVSTLFSVETAAMTLGMLV